MKKAKIKYKCAILFDMDETLIGIDNSYEYFDGIIVKVLKKLGKPVPPKEERDKLWRDVNSSYILKEWRIENVNLFWNTFDEIDFRFRKQMIRTGKMKIFPDVDSTLKYLYNKKNVFLAIATNTPHKIMNFQLKKFKIKKYFHALFPFGGDQSMCKPSPYGLIKILNYLKNHFQISKDKVYLVGDSIHMDIQAGNSAQINTFLINRNNKDITNSKIQPTYIIDNLNQLIPIISESIVSFNNTYNN
ncbi:MAG: HAD family hydrolase [Candidatus Helarchaeota archaeon]